MLFTDVVIMPMMVIVKSRNATEKKETIKMKSNPMTVCPSQVQNSIASLWFLNLPPPVVPFQVFVFLYLLLP